MKRIMILVVVVFAAVVAGCTSAPTRSNYDAYGELLSKQQAAESNLIASIASTANACTDSRCVEHVAAMAAMAAAGGRGSSAVAPPPREPSSAEQFAQVVGAMSPFLGAVVNGAVQWRQSDNAVRTSEAQYGYLDSVLGQALTGMASVADSAVPSITVGGNYGDTYGNGFTGRDRTETNVAGPQVNGNSNVLGDRNFNSGRQDSAGPFDRTCTGDACQPVNPDPAGGG